MGLTRNADGTWTVELINEEERGAFERRDPAFREALPRYLTALDPAFTRARECSEFESLMTLFRFRGIQPIGFDPYETTLRAIPALIRVHDEMGDREGARHLELWIYGHIIEASEPYEILMNLIEVSQGGRSQLSRFPPDQRGVPQSVGRKIEQLRAAAARAAMPEIMIPLEEIWDREFRNAIFHADYALYEDGVRILTPGGGLVYQPERVASLVNRALAYHSASASLYEAHIRSYTEPKEIATHPEFTRGRSERALVIVRQGYGAVGLRDAFTAEEVAAGQIPWYVVRGTMPGDADLLGRPREALLPPFPR